MDEPTSGVAPGTASSNTADRLASKAASLKDPRNQGKYRCRRCNQKPCVCTGQPSAGVRPGAGSVPANLWTPELVIDFGQAPFAIAAAGTKCPDVALDEAEAKRLAVVSSLTLNQWGVPYGGKWVSLSLFSATICGLVISKMLVLAAHREALRVKLVDNEIEKSRAKLKEKAAAPGLTPGGPVPSVPPNKVSSGDDKPKEAQNPLGPTSTPATTKPPFGEPEKPQAPQTT